MVYGELFKRDLEGQREEQTIVRASHGDRLPLRYGDSRAGDIRCAEQSRKEDQGDAGVAEKRGKCGAGCGLYGAVYPVEDGEREGEKQHQSEDGGRDGVMQGHRPCPLYGEAYGPDPQEHPRASQRAQGSTTATPPSLFRAASATA